MSNDTQTLTLTDFLLARIAEDEVVAKFVGSDSPWECEKPTLYASARWDRPETLVVTVDYQRVLAECEAKRRIVEADERNRTDLMRETDSYAWTTRILAAVYADHPDYRDEWMPTSLPTGTGPDNPIIHRTGCTWETTPYCDCGSDPERALHPPPERPATPLPDPVVPDVMPRMRCLCCGARRHWFFGICLG